MEIRHLKGVIERLMIENRKLEELISYLSLELNNQERVLNEDPFYVVYISI